MSRMVERSFSDKTVFVVPSMHIILQQMEHLRSQTHNTLM